MTSFRNLPGEVAKILRAKIHENQKHKVTNPKGSNQHTTKEDGAQNDPQPKTAQIIAQAHNVSEATVKRDAQFLRATDKLGITTP